MKSLRRTRLALTVAAVALSVGATGCSYMNPVQTHDFYQAADGTNVSLQDSSKNFTFGVRNAVVVVNDDKRGELLASVVNYTDEDATVTLEGTDDGDVIFSQRVKVPANTTIQVEPKDLRKDQDPEESTPLEIGVDDFPVAAGATMELTMTVDGQKRTETMPVTDTSLAYYKGSGGSASDGAASDGGASDGGSGSGEG
ncbi:hypothetical protein [Brachybacterium sp. ACRRE]|uniref:hypothetical protein n=1 Tax=Brachybacterium sp. ACRRE TaxID=2918184 RepID=UPI001EF1BA0B|nr:hypothetical protein [Brachybacterium sp. ACRRE]